MGAYSYPRYPIGATQIQPPPSPLEILTGIEHLQNLRNQGQLQQQAVQANQYAQQQRMAVNNAYQSALKTDENGAATIDNDELQRSLAAAGHGSAIPSILKSLTDAKESQTRWQQQQADLQKAGADAMGSYANAIKTANYDPHFADLLLQEALGQPNLPDVTKRNLQGFRQRIAQNPESLKQDVDALIAASTQQRVLGRMDVQAGARKQQADAAMLKQGMKPDPDNPGQYVKMDPSEYPPQLASQIQRNDAVEQYQQAHAEWMQARASGEPKRIQQAQARLNQAQQNYQLRNQQFERDTFGTVGGQAVPGGATDAQGNPIGSTSPGARRQLKQTPPGVNPKAAPHLPALPPQGFTRMQAPNGDTQDVPNNQVDHYKKLGAKAVQ